MSNQKRFSQPLYSIAHFCSEILVKCPKCEAQAKVNIKTLENYNIKKSLICKSCHFRAREGWFGKCQGFITFHCGFCGSKIEHQTKPTKKIFDKTSFECPKCNVRKSYPLKWYRYDIFEEGFEPYFGLELWLKTSLKGKTLWAYNAQHLKYLKDFLGASLREDDNRSKYSIVTNLPKWMKSAKNRDLVLKKLRSLEKRAKS